jgi:hypothetical protein
MQIGLDFDNTLVRYDGVFARLAAPHLPPPLPPTKDSIRDALRRLPDGEALWRRLQGQAYGARMAEAEPFPGADDFLARARAAGHALFIVSHKTQYGHDDPTRVDLRDAAMAWIAAQGWLAHVDREGIFFEPTREAKLARIAALGLDVFIEDLADVLNDPAFPASVRAVHFGGPGFPDWTTVARELLG